jgi:hypothetical protein
MMAVATNVSDIIFAILDTRAVEATICPSEVARAIANDREIKLAADDWRSVMPAVHNAVDVLVSEGRVQLSWKGVRLGTRVGPYRIGRCP